MSGKSYQVSAATKEKIEIMQDRASAVLTYNADDTQCRVYLFVLQDGKKYIYDHTAPTAEEVILLAWQFYLEESKRGVEWIRGEVLPE